MLNLEKVEYLYVIQAIVAVTFAAWAFFAQTPQDNPFAYFLALTSVGSLKQIIKKSDERDQLLNYKSFYLAIILCLYIFTVFYPADQFIPSSHKEIIAAFTAKSDLKR